MNAAGWFARYFGVAHDLDELVDHEPTAQPIPLDVMPGIEMPKPVAWPDPTCAICSQRMSWDETHLVLDDSRHVHLRCLKEPA